MAAVAGRFETFARDIKVATAGLDQKAIAAEMAAFAKQELKLAIANGEASESYDRYVNGIKDAPEESVIPPGPIIYVFGYWSLIIRTAIDELRKRVAVRSGRYAGSFLVLANGKPVQEYAGIPSEAEVVIFNAQPYTRKMEVGANKTGKNHFRNASQALNRRFKGTAVSQDTFLNVQSGVAAGVPYVLRGTAGAARRRVRKDRQPGQPITYPALVINMVQ